MREFIEALFEKENKIEFQYEDYEMSFFAGRFKSYYLIFYSKRKIASTCSKSSDMR